MELTKEQLAIGDVLLAELCYLHDKISGCAGDVTDGLKAKEQELIGRLNRVYAGEQTQLNNN